MSQRQSQTHCIQTQRLLAHQSTRPSPVCMRVSVSDVLCRIPPHVLDRFSSPPGTMQNA